MLQDHWQQWQRSPVKFAEALSLARNLSESKGFLGWKKSKDKI